MMQTYDVHIPLIGYSILAEWLIESNSNMKEVNEKQKHISF